MSRQDTTRRNPPVLRHATRDRMCRRAAPARPYHASVPDQPIAVDAPDMSLRDYASVLRRRKWLILLPMVLAPLVAYGLSLGQESRYRSSAEVLVREPPSATAVGAPERPMQQRVLQNELQRAQGSALRDLARDVVGPEPSLSVDLAAEEETDVFVFTAVSIDPETAARAANAYALTYIEARQRSLVEELDARIKVVEGRLVDIDEDVPTATGEELDLLIAQRNQYEFELESLTVSVDLAENSGASLIDAASVPTVPVEPRPRRSAFLAFLMGTFLGLGAALLVDHFDSTLRDEDDLAKITHLPVLGTVPRVDPEEGDGRPISMRDPTAPSTEAYRALRTSLQFLGVDRDSNAFQFTSAKPGDGKTTTSTNVGVVSALAGQRVVVVDCDLRRPRIHEFFSLPNDQGFTSAIIGASLDEVTHQIDGVPNLSVITSGPVPPDPFELLSTPTARHFIASLRRDFDLVVIDTPPVLVVADPLVISSYVDGVILVAAAGDTDRRQIKRATEELAKVQAPLLGSVLNAFDTENQHSYGYRYAYGRYEPTPQ